MAYAKLIEKAVLSRDSFVYTRRARRNSISGGDGAPLKEWRRAYRWKPLTWLAFLQVRSRSIISTQGSVVVLPQAAGAGREEGNVSKVDSLPAGPVFSPAQGGAGPATGGSELCAAAQGATGSEGSAGAATLVTCPESVTTRPEVRRTSVILGPCRGGVSLDQKCDMLMTRCGVHVGQRWAMRMQTGGASVVLLAAMSCPCLTLRHPSVSHLLTSFWQTLHHCCAVLCVQASSSHPASASGSRCCHTSAWPSAGLTPIHGRPCNSFNHPARPSRCHSTQHHADLLGAAALPLTAPVVVHGHGHTLCLLVCSLLLMVVVAMGCCRHSRHAAELVGVCTQCSWATRGGGCSGAAVSAGGGHASWKGTLVAVKVMRLPPSMDGNEKREKMAIMETAISSSLSHPNVVQTFTYSVQQVPHCPDTKSLDLPSSAAQGLHAPQSSLAEVDGEGGTKLGGWDKPEGGSSWEVRLVQEYCEAGSLRELLDKK
ncbi:protein kinase domain-containing protein, partial [Haematococcus lacustris]